MSTQVVVDEEYEGEGSAQFEPCSNCGAALPNVELLVKSCEEFFGHLYVETRCARCDEEYCTVLHFCGDTANCDIAHLELRATKETLQS
jgi:hypothetical protein